MKKRILSLALTLSLLMAALSGCGSAAATDLMKGVAAKPVEIPSDFAAGSAVATDFAVRLFHKSAEEGKNTLISPLSVLSALAMTMNGAQGETRNQMEEALGLPAEELNAWLHAYMNGLVQSEQSKLSLANSIWFTEDEAFTVEEGFLQTNADYYGADIYQAPFDSSTKNAINKWVKDKTDGMIEEIVNEIPPLAVMYLVNALAFDAEWSTIYKDRQVRDGIFTKEDGTEQEIELMHSSEYAYLDDGNATGFLKYYKGGNYAFVALLPNAGVSVAEYVAGLSGEHLQTMLASSVDVEVNAAIPRFETEYAVEMSETLKRMGIADAFDIDKADFSSLGHHPMGIYISRVLHKTYIAVDEKGPRAGAATSVEMAAGAAAPMEEPKVVILDRPFVYMLIDCETNLPFFMGTMMDMAG